VRVPLAWLRELCPVRLSAEEIADVLTAQGVELDRLLRPWEDLSGVRVARVLEVRDHPGADRLCVAEVDDEQGQREVVVGVRNMRSGDLVPYAPPGATLPGMEEKLERREIRGVASDGMLCSPKELGISADHSVILVLPQDLAPGADLKEALELDDAVLDLEINPNRPDLLSVLGVARELAAATGQDLLPPDTSVSETVDRAEQVATVEVLDREGCPRYLARVIRGVRVGPSPLIAQVRLAAAGMRPLQNVVDATNYVMLELGQPLHPFDLRRLAGPGVVVRTAEGKDRLTTLDGIERTLTNEDLLICDVERPVAIGGVMGGGESEVGEDTTEVLLESANFNPVRILRTARRLGLRTEASIRFERGADPEAAAPAAARTAALIAAWSGGEVLAGAVDEGAPPPRRTVSVRPARAAMVLGTDLSAADVREALGRLRLPATEEQERVVVEVPSYRVDLELEEDLIEEVGRVTGYHRIPSSLPGVRQAGGLTPEQRLRRRVRDVLGGAGLFEVRSTSFAPDVDARLFADRRAQAVRMANPMSEEDAYLRTSLLPGLLRAARRNVGNRRASVRLFEMGTTFVAGEPVPVEEERLAVVLHGPVSEEWPGDRREHDVLDAKGVLEHLLVSMGIEGWNLGEAAGPPYHPGRSALVVLDGEIAGEVGELHPQVVATFDLSGRVAVADILVPSVVAGASGAVAYREVSRYPPVRRDLAFLVDLDVPAGAVRSSLVDAAGDLLDRVELFDVFQGDPLPPGKKSLAFTVDLRALHRTLTDEEADRVFSTIAERVAADVGAELRAG
jgi:phenylalanyl-tRNA synthetase beta chain